MRDELLLYYERELTWLRQMGTLFSEKYPKIASRLAIEPGKCEDPHVERLLEAFSFLAARVHLKVDDEFPEITQSLLGIVYPHFIRPIPSMSIVEFQVDVEQGKLTSGLKIPRETLLYSRPVGGVPCKFRTSYDTTLYPVNVTNAQWISPDRLRPTVRAADAAHALRVEFSSPADTPFLKLDLDSLRFHLFGEGSLVHILYEILCSKLTFIVLRDPANPRLPPVVLPPSSLRPVGFGDDEGMLPYPRRSFTGYRLLQEYFAMPEKFFFVEIAGLKEAWGSGFKNTAELVFLFSNVGDEDRRQRLEIGITPKTFRLGCTPVINLFPQTAEPLRMDQRKYEYPIVPDLRRPTATEVFSIDSVSSIDSVTRETVTYRPFYSYRHQGDQRNVECFWTATSRPSVRVNDDALDVYLTLVDRSMGPVRPDADTVTVRTTCSNRNLPARLPFGNESGDFELETNAPIKRIVALRKPTEPLRPYTDRASLWQLISHLSLNYLSLVSEGREALQQVLRLYDFANSQPTQKMIEGIAAVNSKPHFARLISENGISFVRGTRVELDLDLQQFVGGGAYLFAAVLEQFLARYVSLNSFSQLIATVNQGKEVLHEWPPRAGQTILM